MIYAQAGAAFELVVSDAPTGLVGTIGVRIIRNTDGATVLARTTAGITEPVAGAGVYLAKLTAPGEPGSYTVLADQGGALEPAKVTTEELVVTATLPRGPEEAAGTGEGGGTVLETFGDIISEVLQFGFNDGPQVNRARIQRWINEGQRQLAREIEAPEFQETQTLQLVPGTYAYPLPGGFLRVQDIAYPLLMTRLRPVDQQQFDLTAPQQVAGPPVIYTLYQQQLWLYPAPNSTDQLLMRYLKRPPQLNANSDIPQLNGNYLHLLVDYALQRAFEAEDDYEAAQYFQGRYERDRDAYASDVQDRIVDRPRQITGTWGGAGESATGL